MKRSTKLKIAERTMRKANVLRYFSVGYTESRIAEILKVSPSTVHFDIVELKKENRKNGAQWLADNLMFEYMKALSALDFLISEHRRIIESSSDIRERIASRHGLRECTMDRMQLIGHYEVTPSSSNDEQPNDEQQSPDIVDHVEEEEEVEQTTSTNTDDGEGEGGPS